ncbi:MAG TPA: BlaI/MecI/CopY family transcriptional regulator [Phycisphaerae bacterium]|nr:BlaI/MecI/CopY family transcriptional regulator [Phycisphaerae bacterium]HOJ75257.1 BlaI/MecI/CopY family transcriptional regulator [Phycisphaerae bacterium]HOM52402.1 BlaI/MecI/CopY family transcriptional regulator [Phycisphaerae bacterium]HON67832.1 BlaI/MecI/CopY family transcriptional regulator [Phycisphaerae bacterium]HPP28241.1 BlaI/MecI/CopY family transcriptional regulator [Phycisphaerae bacterium]
MYIRPVPRRRCILLPSPLPRERSSERRSEMMGALPDGKRRAYTTVLTVMQIMEKKGLLAHKREGMAHVYQPKVAARQVLRPLMRDLLRNFFGGNASTAMQYLLDEAKIDRDELEQIRKLINEYDHQAGPKGGGK